MPARATRQSSTCARGGAEIAFAEEPDLGRAAAVRPALGRRHSQRSELSFPRSVGAVAPRDDPPRAPRQPLGDRAYRDGARLSVGKDRQMRRDPEGVWETDAAQVLPQRSVVPEFCVAQHGGDLHAAGPDPPQQRQRQAPFFLKANRARNLGRLARLAGEPLLRQIQRRAQQPRHGRPSTAPPSRRLGNWPLCPACRNWRATPTECRPCFGKLVASRISTPARSPQLAPDASALQGACVMKCWND